MASPPPPRRSGRTRTAPKLFLDSYPPPSSPTRKSPKAKTNVPSRDSEQQEGEQQPAQQPAPENTTGLLDPPETNPLPKIKFFFKGEKRKAGSDDDRPDDSHAGPSSVPRDIGDSRPSKQRIVEKTPSIIYPSIEIPLGMEDAEAGAVPRQISGSVYGDENKENIPPASELSTIILSSDESESGWRGFRGRSRGSDRSVGEREERLRSASYERGRRWPDDIRLEQAERRGSENLYKIDVIRTQVATNEEKSAQLEQKSAQLKARINALCGTTNISTTVYQQQSRELQRLTARVDALEQNMPTRRHAPAPSTVPMDARILTRLQEIQQTDPGDPNFQKLVDFYEHFGINWRHLESRYRECNNKMPDAVCGVYYLRAKAKLRLEGNTEKQRDADEKIILASDAITGIWLTTKERDGELESLLTKEFADLFMKVCEREAMGPDEPSQQDAQPAPRRGRR